MEKKRELKRNFDSFGSNKESISKQKIIRQLMKDLEIICVEIDPPRENYLEELLQNDCRALTSHYDQNDPLIKELQEKIDKIKKQENAQLNRELAFFLCQKLLKREKN